MPSSYTWIIEDDPIATFEQYAWRCARAFGAFAGIRESSLDEPAPEEIKPDPYYAKRVKAVQDEISKLDAMTIEEATRLATEEYKETEAENRERAERHSILRQRYSSMRDRVEAWTPPSVDHVELKEFMLKQINESIIFDCNPYQQKLPTTNGRDWLQDQCESAQESLACATQRWANELKRVTKQNQWIRKLRESIPCPIVPHQSPQS